MLSKLAKIIRVISIPPIFAALLALFLWIKGASVWESLTILLCIALCPVIPYLITKDRKKQRFLAFVFSAVGYLIAWLISFFTHFGAWPKFVITSYVFSVIILAFINKVIKIKASGHACGIAGPIVATALLFGSWVIPICILVYASVFWASIYTKRHTVLEFLLGTASVLISMAFSYLIYLA